MRVFQEITGQWADVLLGWDVQCIEAGAMVDGERIFNALRASCTCRGSSEIRGDILCAMK